MEKKTFYSVTRHDPILIWDIEELPRYDGDELWGDEVALTKEEETEFIAAKEEFMRVCRKIESFMNDESRRPTREDINRSKECDEQ